MALKKLDDYLDTMTDSYKDCFANIINPEKLIDSLEKMLEAGKCVSEVLWHLFHLLRNLCRVHDALEDIAQIYDEIIVNVENISTNFQTAVLQSIGLSRSWKTEYTTFRLDHSNIKNDIILDKILIDFITKCNDPRYPNKVTDIMTKIVKSTEVEEKIVQGFISTQLKEFYEKNIMDQTNNSFCIVDNENSAILTVQWKFLLTDKI